MRSQVLSTTASACWCTHRIGEPPTHRLPTASMSELTSPECRLEFLDGLQTSPEEKVKGANLFGADVEHRKSVHERHIEEEPFVNHMYAQCCPVSPCASPNAAALVANQAAL